jgi:triosephosphate isomerase
MKVSPMRKLFIAGNWKMYLTLREAEALTRGILGGMGQFEDVDCAVCPPSLAVPTVAALCRESRLKVGVQNLFWEDEGAYTGEISPQMAAEICSLAIVGHSERRKYFGETDVSANRRLKAALKAGLEVILCVGETLEENETGITEAVVSRQVRSGLAGVHPTEAAHVTIAYEPVWAIGTGRAATPQDANRVHRNMIRPILKDLFGENQAQHMRIQYGGSIKPENAAELFAMSDIDGGLVGGASLKAEPFLKILAAAAMVAIVQDEVED